MKHVVVLSQDGKTHADVQRVYNELTLERPWLWRACSLFAPGKSKCSSALRKKMHTVHVYNILHLYIWEKRWSVG